MNVPTLADKIYWVILGDICDHFYALDKPNIPIGIIKKTAFIFQQFAIDDSW